MADGPSDFDQIRGLAGRDYAAELPGMAETEMALGRMRDMQSRMVAQQKQQDPMELLKYAKKVTFKQTPEGGTEMSTDGTDPRFVQDLLRQSKQLNEIMGAFHQEAARLQLQEQQQMQQPWMQLATALSANLAQARDMPGWVQALGRTAAQLNPPADVLRARRMGVMGEEAQIAERAAGLDIAMERTMEAAATRREAQAQHLETMRRTSVRQAVDDAITTIKAGTGDVDGNAIMRGIATAGATPKELESYSGLLGGLAAERKKEWDTSRGDKAEAQRIAQANEDRRARLETLQIGKKTEAEQAIEAAAQSLAKGDLTALKDIASLRGDQRLRIYARAKEINPNFSPAETNRKIAMEQSFTVGKDSIGIQSFDTFLQHAGEVTETLKGIKLTGSPAFNKPMNWWRKNMAGSPEYQRLIASMEPVTKEFESFLLNQRALYADDRRRMDIILSPDSTPAQIMAALNQMGKTAKDRYGAMNQRYKRVMGQDIQNPFSPEGLAGAAKIGIDLPQSSEETPPPLPWRK